MGRRVRRGRTRNASLGADACLELLLPLILVWRRADRDSVSVSSEALEERGDLDAGLMSPMIDRRHGD